MTGMGTAPGRGDLEITLLGPGYGESVVLHVGGGVWVIVDSCLNANGSPQALRYLESIGIDPAKAVDLIVATHWHDDHIRGIADVVKACKKATFCCASVLREKDFLTAAHALEGGPLSGAGSGMREIYNVISQLKQVPARLRFALANRRIFYRGECEIWALSPHDSNFLAFLKIISGLITKEGESKRRIPSLSPNNVAVALWVKVKDIALLLGSDLERIGWVEILQDKDRPNGKASVFKVPHHGSKNAYKPGVWKQMLNPNPFAVITPWRKGGSNLPTPEDVQRILSYTTNAYVTAGIGSSSLSPAHRISMVRRTIKESGIQLRRLAMSPGAVRLRRPIRSRTQWKVETFGPARHLKNFTSNP